LETGGGEPLKPKSETGEGEPTNKYANECIDRDTGLTDYLSGKPQLWEEEKVKDYGLAPEVLQAAAVHRTYLRNYAHAESNPELTGDQQTTLASFRTEFKAENPPSGLSPESLQIALSSFRTEFKAGILVKPMDTALLKDINSFDRANLNNLDPYILNDDSDSSDSVDETKSDEDIEDPREMLACATRLSHAVWVDFRHPRSLFKHRGYPTSFTEPVDIHDYIFGRAYPEMEEEYATRCELLKEIRCCRQLEETSATVPENAVSGCEPCKLTKHPLKSGCVNGEYMFFGRWSLHDERHLRTWDEMHCNVCCKTMTVKDYPRHLVGMPHARMVSHLDKTVDTDFPAYTTVASAISWHFVRPSTQQCTTGAVSADGTTWVPRPKRNGRAKRSPDGNLS
jgi:hypothetical protein